MNTIVELQHIYKSFGTNEVLSDVSLSFNSAEVHALDKFMTKFAQD